MVYGIEDRRWISGAASLSGEVQQSALAATCEIVGLHELTIENCESG
jgi:hypothetical protein